MSVFRSGIIVARIKLEQWLWQHAILVKESQSMAWESLNNLFTGFYFFFTFYLVFSSSKSWNQISITAYASERPFQVSQVLFQKENLWYEKNRKTIWCNIFESILWMQDRSCRNFKFVCALSGEFSLGFEFYVIAFCNIPIWIGN